MHGSKLHMDDTEGRSREAQREGKKAKKTDLRQWMSQLAGPIRPGIGPTKPAITVSLVELMGILTGRLFQSIDEVTAVTWQSISGTNWPS